jgi:signal transduction histidine kinase
VATGSTTRSSTEHVSAGGGVVSRAAGASHGDERERAHESLSALSVLLDRADREDDALRDVAEMLSHELRTPLTTIYSGSKILSRPGAPLAESTVREVSAAIEAEAERLKRIVEDLVVAALPESRSMGAEPVLIQHVLPSIVHHEQMRTPGPRFVISLPEHLPAVRGDELYLEQVLRNLLSNAVRFGPADGVIAVNVSERPGVVTVRVTDEGPGIEADEEDRVFGLFYRSPATADRAGLGLGLFVCRRLVDSMGGRIWGRGRPNGGAEFGFDLPVYPSDER